MREELPVSDTTVPVRPVMMVLQIDTNGDPTYARGFTKETVASMFGWSFEPKEILVLEHDGVEMLSIPWPDGMTLDKALLAWASTQRTANRVEYGARL